MTIDESTTVEDIAGALRRAGFDCLLGREEELRRAALDRPGEFRWDDAGIFWTTVEDDTMDIHVLHASPPCHNVRVIL